MKYQTTELADGLWCIAEERVQCYLIVGEKRALLFDCCLSGGIEFKQAVGLITDKPVQLLISHSDGDHTAAQQYFDSTTMHVSEFSRYVDRGNDPAQAKPVWEGHVFDLGGVRLEVVLIPGHTPGSIALLDRENRRLFAGDTLSDHWIYMFGAGRNLEAFIESTKKLESLTPMFDSAYCCHGSMALGIEWIGKTRTAAEKLLAGTLDASEPPVDVDAMSYCHDGVVFFR